MGQNKIGWIGDWKGYNWVTKGDVEVEKLWYSKQKLVTTKEVGIQKTKLMPIRQNGTWTFMLIFQEIRRNRSIFAISWLMSCFYFVYN